MLKYLPEQVDPAVHEADTADRLGSVSPDRLRQLTQKKSSHDSLKNIENPSALVTVLRHEMARFNRLLAIIHSSLKSLCSAVKGQALMSQQLEEAYSALLSNRVPKEWEVRLLVFADRRAEREATVFRN